MASPFAHIVVLMMENRSFDHMLGYLKDDDYPIDGLNGDETNPAAVEGPAIRVSPDARSIGDLNPDPSHEFQDINVQIFGDPNAIDTGQVKMQGFVQNYATDSKNAIQGENVMKCFHVGSLPVLSTLATQYAICDRWFSSVPASTIPNRLFAHAASSGGSLTQDAVLAPATAKTIFQVIDDPANPATYRIYSNGSTILMANLYLAHNQNKFFDYSSFQQDCKDDLLPEYTFIEPSYDDNLSAGQFATSQHPDFAIDAGEGLIAQVYNAVRSSPSWNDTLLLIVYDEHGGLFDHVTPPALTPNPAYPAIPPSQDFGFKFDRLGVRVPAVFVSPRIQAGTILHQQFDHCSIVATVRKLFCLDKTPFNWREAQAATFDGIANLTDAQIRTDTVVLPAPVASDGTIPLQRDLVLAPSDQQAIAASMTAAGVVPVVHAVAEDFTTANAPPVLAPPLSKPTDLVVLMAQAMEHTVGLMGLSTSSTVNQIYSAQDAARYLQEAWSVIKQVSGA
jgi:phospholipase C